MGCVNYDLLFSRLSIVINASILWGEGGSSYDTVKLCNDHLWAVHGGVVSVKKSIAKELLEPN